MKPPQTEYSTRRDIRRSGVSKVYFNETEHFKSKYFNIGFIDHILFRHPFSGCFYFLCCELKFGSSRNIFCHPLSFSSVFYRGMYAINYPFYSFTNATIEIIILLSSFVIILNHLIHDLFLILLISSGQFSTS